MRFLKRRHSPSAAFWRWWARMPSSEFVPAASQSCPERATAPLLSAPWSERPTSFSSLLYLSFHLSVCPCLLTLLASLHLSVWPFPATFVSSDLFLFVCVGCFFRRDVLLLPQVGERSGAGWMDNQTGTSVHAALSWLMTGVQHKWMSPQTGIKY